MRGVYTTANKVAAVVAAKTLLYITAPSTAIVEMLSASVTNESNATNYQIEAFLARITALGTPTATTVTPSPHEAGDQAAASTVKVNVTASEPTYAAQGIQEGAPSVAGWFWPPPGGDEERHRYYVAPSASAGIKLVAPSTPASTDFDVRLTHAERG